MTGLSMARAKSIRVDLGIDFPVLNTSNDKNLSNFEESLAKYLPSVTSGAISYAYQNTSERSPLRKLLAYIFVYNVKPETLNKDILSFLAEFMAEDDR